MNGFSLLEVLVALIILTGGLLAFSKAQIISLRYNQDSYRQTLAQYQNSSLIEQLRLCSQLSNPSICKNSAVNNWRSINSSLIPQSQSQIKYTGSDYQFIIEWEDLLQANIRQNQKNYRRAILYARN